MRKAFGLCAVLAATVMLAACGGSGSSSSSSSGGESGGTTGGSGESTTASSSQPIVVGTSHPRPTPLQKPRTTSPTHPNRGSPKGLQPHAPVPTSVVTGPAAEMRRQLGQLKRTRSNNPLLTPESLRRGWELKRGTPFRLFFDRLSQTQPLQGVKHISFSSGFFSKNRNFPAPFSHRTGFPAILS